VFPASAADNNKALAYYCGAFVEGSSRVLGSELRLRNGKFVYIIHHDLVFLFLISTAH
jgi:hypothetical protein